MFTGRRRGLTLIELVLYVAAIICLSVTLFGTNPVKSVASDNMVERGLAVDTALSLYYFARGHVYPNALTELQPVYFPPSVNLSEFSYSVQAGNTQYRLEVTLPNGAVFVTPGSKF